MKVLKSLAKVIASIYVALSESIRIIKSLFNLFKAECSAEIKIKVAEKNTTKNPDGSFTIQPKI